MSLKRFVQTMALLVLAAVSIVSLGLWLGWSEVTT